MQLKTLFLLLILTGAASAQELRGYIRLEANGKVYEQETTMIDPGPRQYTVYREPSSFPYREPSSFPYRRPMDLSAWGYPPSAYYGSYPTFGGYGGSYRVQFRGAYTGGYRGAYGTGYCGPYGVPRGNYHRGYINR